jgi:hypothetical protein
MADSSIHATLQVYDPAHDLASLDLAGDGSIDAWLDGVHIDPTIARAYMAGQIPGFVHFPDEYRFDNAVVLGIIPPTTVTSTTATEQGRSLITTGALGGGSASVSFSPTFSASPQVAVTMDNGQGCTLSATSSTGFTVTITGAAHNAQIGFSWSATGS